MPGPLGIANLGDDLVGAVMGRRDAELHQRQVWYAGATRRGAGRGLVRDTSVCPAQQNALYCPQQEGKKKTPRLGEGFIPNQVSAHPAG